jgi:hypothetical protein
LIPDEDRCGVPTRKPGRPDEMHWGERQPRYMGKNGNDADGAELCLFIGGAQSD